jgi:cysteinyl-tRNA synthetase
MRLYNTLTRTIEEFEPIQPGKVSFYICGPTVYNHIHIGNARTFLSFDVIRRYLEWSGYDVTYVQNITDVDDKIINRANEEGRSAAEVATEYSGAFIEAMHALGIKDPTVRPRATEEIPAMIELISCLVDEGHAYEVEGDVYFSVRSFAPYGRLSGCDVDAGKTGTRVELDPRKRDPLDFALWKAAKPGEPSWPSPWSAGRPGWHIECSAMSAKYLGNPFDIHAGGNDLIFPHHENEIAQSEACTHTTFANYWLHGGMLTINQEKMSKSEGNFLLLKDVLTHVRPAALRLLMLQTHYRSPCDYSPDRLVEATTSLERIETALFNMRWAAQAAASECHPALINQTAATRQAFKTHMDEDFNPAGAIAAIFELVSAGNVAVAADTNCTAGAEAITAAADTIVELLAVLGVQVELPAGEGDELPIELVTLASKLASYEGDIPAQAADLLLEARAEARAAKDWARADAIRDGLAEQGYTIEDTPQGTRVVRK